MSVPAKYPGQKGNAGRQGPTDTSSHRGIDEKEWRILLIGKTGHGKSATANTILGRQHFESRLSAQSVTRTCQTARAKRFGKEILLVDTPGFFDTSMTQRYILNEITKCIAITSPGMHAIILVTRIGRVTEEEKKTVKLLCDFFGENIIHHLIIVFTEKDEIIRQRSSIEEYLGSIDRKSMLYDLIEKIEHRYVAFDNLTMNQTENDDQVFLLFDVIEKMIHDNGAKFYTNDMFQEAEMVLDRLADEERKCLEEEEIRKMLAIVATLKEEIVNGQRQCKSFLDAFQMQSTSLKQFTSKLEGEVKSMQQRFGLKTSERIQAEKKSMERIKEIIDTEKRKSKERRECERERERQREKKRQRDETEILIEDYLLGKEHFLEKELGKFEGLIVEYKHRKNERTIRDTTRNGFERGTFELLKEVAKYAFPVLLGGALRFLTTRMS